MSGQRRPEIELSWHRSQLYGIVPEQRPRDLPAAEIDPASRLACAARPVLGAMAEHLEGTRYSLLMTDRDCRLSYRWFGSRFLESVLDALGLREGADVGEGQLGTNALGTATETRAGITVHGADHFIEPLKEFSCYGHPIRHPVTGRLEGALDISGGLGDANPLLAPYLRRAVSDIEERLLAQATASERALLAAFQAEVRPRSRAVAALGGDLILTSKAALDLLAPEDYARLRALAEDLGPSSGRRLRVALASGAPVDLHLRRVPESGDGVVFAITLRPRDTVPGPRHDPSAARSVLVHGAPGTGRSYTARELAPDAPVLDCSDAALDPVGWGRELRGRLRDSRALRIENIDLLPEEHVSRVAAALGAESGPRLVLTSPPADRLTGTRAALGAAAVERIGLRPLSSRAGELPRLAMKLVRQLDPTADIRLVPTVIEALSAQSWPGNVSELRAVITHVLRHRTVGDVILADLPEDYRNPSRAVRLAGRERAEREAIVAALSAHDGNKMRAARELGISRTTLYARMRALRVAD